MKVSSCFFLLLQASVQNHTLRPDMNAKNILTTLADRRRAGPPAFRRKYRQKLKATLSPTLGGRLFNCLFLLSLLTIPTKHHMNALECF